MKKLLWGGDRVNVLVNDEFSGGALKLQHWAAALSITVKKIVVIETVRNLCIGLLTAPPFYSPQIHLSLEKTEELIEMIINIYAGP
jgi:hypothetical protein